MRKFLIIIFVLAFLGFLDSTYLTILHYQNIFPPCSIINGCEKVVTSQFSSVLGIPLSLLGSIYFALVMIFSIIVLEKRKYKKILFFLAIIGFIISAFLFIVQAFVIHAFCQFCLFSEALSVFILIFSFILIRLKQEVR